MKMTICTVVGFETRCGYIFLDDLKLAILLPQSAKCWHARWVPSIPCLMPTLGSHFSQQQRDREIKSDFGIMYMTKSSYLILWVSLSLTIILWNNKETCKPSLLKTMFHMIHPEGMLLPAPPHIPSHPKSGPFFLSLENEQVEQTNNKLQETHVHTKLTKTLN